MLCLVAENSNQDKTWLHRGIYETRWNPNDAQSVSQTLWNVILVALAPAAADFYLSAGPVI